MFKQGKWLFIACLSAGSLLVMASLSGCSDDTGRNQPHIPSNNNSKIEPDADGDTSPDDDDTDWVKPGNPCDEIVCEEGEECVEGVCEPVAISGSACSAPIDLGVLRAGEPLLASADPTGWPNLHKTGCSVDDQSPQAVFSFTLERDSRIDLTMVESGEPLVMEIRRDCGDVESAVLCESLSGVVYGEAGETYYLVVEARRGWHMSEFEVELEATGLVCMPLGAWSCDDNQRVLCDAGEEEHYFECAAGCSEGVCEGEVCENAIEVSGAIAVNGKTGAFENSFDFGSQPSCSAEGTTGAATPGQDVVFHLPGLKSGQRILVDTTHVPGVSVIGVLRSCDISAGCAAAADGILDWEVDTDGDYYVIIDRIGTINTDFDYRIEVID